jgi:hypothetical protein
MDKLNQELKTANCGTCDRKVLEVNEGYGRTNDGT